MCHLHPALSIARLCRAKSTAFFVGQTLAFGPNHDTGRSLAVGHAERRPIRVAEGELLAVAVQVPTADVMKRADDATLEQREEPLHGVRVDVALGIHAVRVLDGVVLRVAVDQSLLGVEFVGHHVRVQADPRTAMATLVPSCLARQRSLPRSCRGPESAATASVVVSTGCLGGQRQAPGVTGGWGRRASTS